MTSSQDPPLTRREARERERLAAQAGGQPLPRASTSRPIAVQPDGTADAPQMAAPKRTIVPSSAQAGETERTLTRRQLRAMLQAQQAAQQVGAGRAPAAASPEPTAEPAPQPASGEQAEPARFTAVADSGPGSGPVIEAQIIDSEPDDDDVDDEVEAPFAPLVVPKHPSPAPSIVPSPPPQSGLVDPAALPQSTLDIDTAGSGSATSALILPVVPTPPATGPLTRAGEILVTGSIDLPRSLATTGQHPNRFDSAEMDRMFDAETDPNTSTIEPVRASRAISTHAPTGEMVTPAPKHGSRFHIVLAVAACVLLLGVIALVVAGFIFGAF